MTGDGPASDAWLKIPEEGLPAAHRKVPSIEPLPLASTTEASDWLCSRPAGWDGDLLRRVFAIDVLERPRCGARMRWLSVVHPPEATRAILECLDLPAHSLHSSPCPVQVKEGHGGSRERAGVRRRPWHPLWRSIPGNTASLTKGSGAKSPLHFPASPTRPTGSSSTRQRFSETSTSTAETRLTTSSTCAAGARHRVSGSYAIWATTRSNACPNVSRLGGTVRSTTSSSWG